MYCTNSIKEIDERKIIFENSQLYKHIEIKN